ncbi:MAG: TetR/AcrR family transcriptional regulator [Rhodobacteraceae bacterium]|nr:TetR/AcrR family transcriptional regulator [Paracoccaceae bacterium]
MSAPARKTTGDRRYEIVQAALDLAHEHGPGNVSTGMIAGRLGLTQPAIYKHFRRKEDIWATAAQVLAEKVAENLAFARQAHSGPVNRLRCLVLAHLNLVEQTPALPELMTMRDGGREHGGFQGTILVAMSGFRQTLEREVALAIKTKVFRGDMNPADAAQLVLGLIQSMVLRMLVSRNTGVFRADGERLLDLLLDGFMAKGDAQ